jgi:FkbM family methyltransferase
MIAARLKHSLKDVFPSLWVRWHLARLPRSAEAELSLLGNMIGRSDVTVDAGAHYGLYTRALARLSAKVHAFEPLPQIAQILRRTSAANVVVHEVALSDRDGEAELRVPRSGAHLGHALASLEPSAIGGEHFLAMRVHTARLDALVREHVSFVKIDVEGHEMSVLRGGEGLIDRYRPVFLVEAEERHNVGATASLFAFFRQKGYHGFFLRGQVLATTDDFDPRKDQDVSALLSDGGRREGRHYVNNFFFVPSERSGGDILRGL